MGLIPPLAVWSSARTGGGEGSAARDGVSMTPEFCADSYILMIMV